MDFFNTYFSSLINGLLIVVYLTLALSLALFFGLLAKEEVIKARSSNNLQDWLGSSITMLAAVAPLLLAINIVWDAFFGDRGAIPYGMSVEDVINGQLFIEPVFAAIKAILFTVSLFLLVSGNNLGRYMIALVCFIVGFELGALIENPWHLLLTTEYVPFDFSTALISGLLAALLGFFGGKAILLFFKKLNANRAVKTAGNES